LRARQAGARHGAIGAGCHPGANVVSHRSPPCHAGETTRPTSLTLPQPRLRNKTGLVRVAAPAQGDALPAAWT
jgi:hypothetical protein